MIKTLKYSGTNTYLIYGSKGYVLFDTGWAGTFPLFCKALGEIKVSVQDIKYVIISHFHPDHMGIAQNIANLGATIAVADVQRDYVHIADEIFERDKATAFIPIDDNDIVIVPIAKSRDFLNEIGIQGELLHTPGHSDDSISLFLDDGSLLVGDLNPLYELEMHKGTRIYESWKCLLDKKPAVVYYGHAKTARLTEDKPEDEPGDMPVNRQGDKSEEMQGDRQGDKPVDMSGDKPVDRQGDRPVDMSEDEELYYLVKRIMKFIDKGKTTDVIQKKTGADKNFIEDVTRMYLTHKNVGVQGILDRIEIKGR